MERLQVINTNQTVNNAFVGIHALLSLAVLVSSFILCNDIYGAGPAFVAVTMALAMAGYAVFLVVSTQRQALNVKLNMGLSLIVTVTSFQQAIMWGGLGVDVFQRRAEKIILFSPNITASCKQRCTLFEGCVQVPQSTSALAFKLKLPRI